MKNPSFIVLRALARFIHKILLATTEIFVKVTTKHKAEISIEMYEIIKLVLIIFLT